MGGETMKRRILMGAAALSLILPAGMALAQDLPPLEAKDSYKVGFAQTESKIPGASRRPRAFRTPPGPADGSWC